MNTSKRFFSSFQHPARLALAGLLTIPFLLSMQADDARQPDRDGTLLFRSGFESGSAIRHMGDPMTENDKIIGVDASVSPPNDWVRDIDGSDRLGMFSLQYQGGDTTIRKARIVPEPGNPDNRVLMYQISEPWVNRAGLDMARVQANIYDSYPNSSMTGIRELYQKVRLYLPPDMEILRNFPDRITFLMIMEIWNNHSWDNAPHPFRISVGMGKPRSGTGDLYFMVDAEDYVTSSQRRKIWNDLATDVPIPFGTWMTLEFYIREGDGQAGHFLMAMTPEGGDRKVLFDVRNYTHNTTDPEPGGITHWNPLKLYTSRQLVEYIRDSGTSLRLYWDDLEIWKDRRPDVSAADVADADAPPPDATDTDTEETDAVETEVADAVTDDPEPGASVAGTDLPPGFYIQLEAARYRDRALEMRGEWQSRLAGPLGDIGAGLILTGRKEQQIFELRIGTFPTYNDAASAMNRLEGLLPADAFLISFPRPADVTREHYHDMRVIDGAGRQ